MQRAAKAAYNTLISEWPHATSVIIFCGVGNNAGDGYVLARLLKQNNIIVQVIQIGNVSKLRNEALIAYNACLDSGIQPKAWNKDLAYEAQVVVDAIFGTGLNNELQGDFFDAVKYINTQTNPVLAIDIPSGLDANTGMPLGIAVKADVTITFIALKKGLFAGAAKQYCGKIILADLGINPTEYSQIKAEHN